MNTRQADRIEVNAPASFRRGAGLAIGVGVADLTPHGCRLIDIPRNLSRGETISLRIAGVGPLLGHVRWLRLGREAGLEFDRPLDERLHGIIVGQNRLTPADPYRAEIMELHNRFHDDADAVQADEAEPEAELSDADAGEAVAAPSPADTVADSVELRQAVRVAAANDPAMAVDPEQGSVEVRILDFSQTGLRIGHAGIRATAGSHLTLVFPDNQIVEGEVRWNDGSALGLAVRVDGSAALAANDASPAPPPPEAPWPEESAPEAPPYEAVEGAPKVESAADDAPAGPDAATLARFEALLSAAQALDFVTATVRADAQGLTLHLALREAD